MWEREDEFRSLLRRAAKKATKDILDSLADIAIRDDKLVGANEGDKACRLLPLLPAPWAACMRPTCALREGRLAVAVLDCRPTRPCVRSSCTR